MLQPLRKEDGVRNGSLNNSTQLASVTEGRGGEGHILFTISPLGQMSFPGRSESHTPVPVRIGTIYSHGLYEPRTTVGFCRNCADQQVFGIKQLCPGLFIQLTPLTAPNRKQEPGKHRPFLPGKPRLALRPQVALSGQRLSGKGAREGWVCCRDLFSWG